MTPSLSAVAIVVIVGTLSIGYAAGMFHARVRFRRQAGAELYCPRCRHYLKWRDALTKNTPTEPWN